MAGLRYFDRVQETTQTTGTGPVTLAGAVPSFQSFGSRLSNQERCYYEITDSTNQWEVGLGTYTTGTNTLSRDEVIESSNSDALVNLAAGTSFIFLDLPSKSIADTGLTTAIMMRWPGY